MPPRLARWWAQFDDTALAADRARARREHRCASARLRGAAAQTAADWYPGVNAAACTAQPRQRFLRQQPRQQFLGLAGLM
jgi:hypothetical protein